MFCPIFGKKLKSGAKFCTNCGAVSLNINSKLEDSTIKDFNKNNDSIEEYNDLNNIKQYYSQEKNRIIKKDDIMQENKFLDNMGKTNNLEKINIKSNKFSCENLSIIILTSIIYYSYWNYNLWCFWGTK